jgi:6-pyruvoyltetrahydropterin/6-carboxytetrahydropterin synthase
VVLNTEEGRHVQLTANRRFRFSASRRLAHGEWTAAENERVYGAGGEGTWGSGENFEAFFVFAGEVDAETGLLVNLAEVKRRLRPVIDERYDHRFLNLDNDSFAGTPPTPENLARELLEEAEGACGGLPARPVACHLRESPAIGATAYANGEIERDCLISFSAARRTYSPRLSEEENRAWFGLAASPAGHGHGYTLRVTLRGAVDEATGVIAPYAEAAAALAELHGMLDHRNLTSEVEALAGEPLTTENLARFAFCRLVRRLPVARVRLNESPELFAEFDGRRSNLGLERSFSAAHCLRVAHWSDEENRRVFGRCANPNGHGHRYTVQATVSAPYDPQSGTVFRLDRLDAALAGALSAWDRRHLDVETDDFREAPSTGERLVLALFPRLDARLDGRLSRLRLFETENNRFTLRRTADE